MVVLVCGGQLVCGEVDIDRTFVLLGNGSTIGGVGVRVGRAVGPMRRELLPAVAWVPACAGMTEGGVGMTEGREGAWVQNSARYPRRARV